MTFAAPLLLLGAALVLPVLLSFLFKRRRKLVRVPSTLLWRRVALNRMRTRRFRFLTRLLSLLLCVAAVAALVLAAAQPMGEAHERTTAIVIDVSASMGGLDEDGPLAKARDHAEALLRERGPNERFVLIAAGPEPRHLAGPTADAAVLDRGMAELAGTRGGGDVCAAVQLAQELVGYSGRIALLHDGGPGISEQCLDRRRVRQRMFAWDTDDGQSRPDNLGIVQLSARPPSDAVSDDDRAVTVIVATSSSATRKALVRLSTEGVVLAEREIQVMRREPAEETVRVRIPAASLVAEVVPLDGLADVLTSDDRAEVALTPARPPKVHLVASQDADDNRVYFVEQALRATGIEQVVRVDPRNQLKVGPEDVLAVVDEAPEPMPVAPTLFVTTKKGPLPYEVVGPLESDAGVTGLMAVEGNHAVTRGVVLDGVTIEHALAIKPGDEGRALVDLDGGTVVATGGAARRRWVYVGIDPLRSDLVLRVAYPVLIANAMAVLGGSTQTSVGDAVPAGETLLASDEPDLRDADEPTGLPVSPAMLLALAAALLAGFEGLMWWRGWTS